jgi:4-carboxymuconolactone decarboxylase
VDYYKKGQQVLVDLGWNKELDSTPPLPDLDRAFWDHTLENLLGRVWGRPGLSVRDREIVVLSVLAAVISPVGIATHLRNAHYIGLSERQVRELLVIVGALAGWETTAAAAAQFDRHLAEPTSSWPESQRLRQEERPDVQVEAVVGQLLDLGIPGGNGAKVAQQAARSSLPDRARADLALMSDGPQLSARDRQIIIISALIAMNSDDVRAHFANRDHVGLTEVELREIVMQAGYYCGWPKFAEATVRLNKVLGISAATS